MTFPYDLNKTGKAAAILLAVYCAAELIFVWHSMTLFNFYDVVEGGTLSNAELDQAAASVDSTGAAVGIFFLVTLIGCFIASGMWIYRVAANAQVVMPDDNRITPGWSVGWFFVPFANLVMPYRALRQHWNGLHGNADLSAGLPGWAFAWWMLWLLGNSISTVSTRMNLEADTIDAFRTSTTLDIVSSGVSILAALLFRHFILVLTRVSASASPHVPRDTAAPQSSIKE
jgi:hypothetical protein